jgi:hypothetical protein
MRGDVTPYITKLITSQTLNCHFHIQAALHTRNVLCYTSDRRLNAPLTSCEMLSGLESYIII